jgi:hypothetical protein
MSKMKKGVLVSSIIPLFVVSLVLLKSAGAEAQKTYQDITSRQLRSLMMDDAGYAFALQCMSDYYRDRVDNGEIPDDELSKEGLADLFLSHFSQKPTYQDRQATELLAIAFKNLPSQIEEQKAIWSKALKAGQAYYSEMSPELAKAYFDALPDHQLPRLAFEQKVPVVEMAYGNLWKLEEKFKEGEPNAVDIGFRLTHISDGAFSEELFHALGEIVARYPRLFLEKAAAYPGRKDLLDDYDYVLDHIILDLVAWWEIPEDDDETRTKALALEEMERERRIKALKTVTDADLRSIRNRCLAKLEAKGPRGQAAS